MRQVEPVIRRHSVQRLSRAQWGDHKSIWSTDLLPGQQLVTDNLFVSEEPVPADVREVLGMRTGELVCRRARRFLVDGLPVQWGVSYLPLERVKGTRVTVIDTGPGGTYARLAPLGYKPVHFRETLRFRQGSEDEIRRLDMDFDDRGVIVIRRVAFYEMSGRLLPIEVTDMVLRSSAYELIYEFDA